MKVFTIKHTTEKKDFEAIIPKVFTNRELADKYLQKLYDEYVEKADGYINWSVISRGKEARIETDNGFDLFEIEEIEIEGRIDYLDEFCREEASFRLEDCYGLSDEQIDGIQEDIRDIIWNVIGNDDALYDKMDGQIWEYLNSNGLINKDEIEK